MTAIVGRWFMRHRSVMVRLHPYLHRTRDEACPMCAAVWSALMADPTFVAGLEAGRADFAAGRVVRWEHRR